MEILSSGGSFILCLLLLSPPELLSFLNSIRNASSPIPFFPKMARTSWTEKEDLSPLLERLKRRYGRPQVVVPLLIKKMDQPQSFSIDYLNLFQRIHTQIFQGYNALEPYMEDSLSSYLLYRTTMSLTPAAKKIWKSSQPLATSGPTWRIVSISWPHLISQIRTHRLPLH